MIGGSMNRLFGLSPSRREVIMGTTARAVAAAFGGFVPRATATAGPLSF